ncbi:DUF7344 domain-containing protein [Haladaptatus caseinilyticus]|uniref:DUF7344 domain-containing protein n=1 Tax=Haladaptatus caseinilyticus TaxID=2993314 RepID=UPI00224A9A6D|nr:hypothetical protein [Haladaptatus caseinilyticus]
MPNSDNYHAPTLALGTAFELLANPMRRQVIYYLRESGQDVASVDELVECVHAETSVVNAPERARVGLVHRHLPKLADHGVIEFDSRSETVRYRDGHRLGAVVAFAAEHER